MKRLFRIIFLFGRWGVPSILALVVICLVIIAAIGSKATLAPKRRSIEPWHEDILRNTENVGITVMTEHDRQGTPYLICEPTKQQKGKKAQLLREELRKRGVAFGAPGEIRGTLMLLHGHKGCKEDHLPICERFCAAGFRCICIDLPGHGKNPASYATFGHTEVSLLLNFWQEFISLQPEAIGPLGIFGVSQGGAIALQMAAHDECAARAIASICSFASLDQPIDASADHLPSILRDVKPLTTRACALGIYCRCGFFPAQISPLQSASNIQRPVFFVHGKDDSFVPAVSSEQLFHAVPHVEKTLRIVDHAGHHNVLSVGSTALYADLCSFFLRHMHP